jgi:hypothetical protein
VFRAEAGSVGLCNVTPPSSYALGKCLLPPDFGDGCANSAQIADSPSGSISRGVQHAEDHDSCPPMLAFQGSQLLGIHSLPTATLRRRPACLRRRRAETGPNRALNGFPHSIPDKQLCLSADLALFHLVLKLLLLLTAEKWVKLVVPNSGFRNTWRVA